jgi:hypothetical protein
MAEAGRLNHVGADSAEEFRRRRLEKSAAPDKIMTVFFCRFFALLTLLRPSYQVDQVICRYTAISPLV